MYHGRGKGCTFVRGDPCSSGTNKEFCNSYGDETKCTLSFDSGGYCSTEETELDGSCMVYTQKEFY